LDLRLWWDDADAEGILSQPDEWRGPYFADLDGFQPVKIYFYYIIIVYHKSPEKSSIIFNYFSTPFVSYTYGPCFGWEN
jgi:hypothetical protein